jgi:hypothetical protein
MKKQYSQLIYVSVFLLSLFMIGSVQAQQNEASKIALYKSSPVWKEMLEDPNANYFEVQKAFQLFWEGKEMPLEEDDVIGERRGLKNNFITRTFNARELKEQQEREALAFDCKKYGWWLIKTEPFIHDDGSLMSAEEKLELWKKHYEELNEQGNK